MPDLAPLFLSPAWSISGRSSGGYPAGGERGGPELRLMRIIYIMLNREANVINDLRVLSMNRARLGDPRHPPLGDPGGGFYTGTWSYHTYLNSKKTFRN
jgi:hypothetical protein